MPLAGLAGSTWRCAGWGCMTPPQPFRVSRLARGLVSGFLDCVRQSQLRSLTRLASKQLAPLARLAQPDERGSVGSVASM
ncbi:hypothetical protein GQ53DRAFT_748665 [Thozetella sp. PMI_491]|nr:hypothetical protein GQ53DRAFT_748665 [Thozetella sp. PMI_491]